MIDTNELNDKVDTLETELADAASELQDNPADQATLEKLVEARTKLLAAKEELAAAEAANEAEETAESTAEDAAPQDTGSPAAAGAESARSGQASETVHVELISSGKGVKALDVVPGTTIDAIISDLGWSRGNYKLVSGSGLGASVPGNWSIEPPGPHKIMVQVAVVGGFRQRLHRSRR